VSPTRVRLRFAKLGKVRWTSHRDVARMWERAFRRVQFPLAYTAGFSPRPRVSFGLALPTGHESVAEYLDVEVMPQAQVDVDALPAVLSAALPAGVDVLAAAAIDPLTPSLQEDVVACTWSWEVAAADGGPTAGEVAVGVEQLLAQPVAVVTRRRKGGEVTEDIRPAIVDLRAVRDGEPPRLEGELATRPLSPRPADVVAALAPEWEARDVRRLNQWIWRDGARCEPLEWAPDATSAARPLERAL